MTNMHVKVLLIFQQVSQTLQMPSSLTRSWIVRIVLDDSVRWIKVSVSSQRDWRLQHTMQQTDAVQESWASQWLSLFKQIDTYHVCINFWKSSQSDCSLKLFLVIMPRSLQCCAYNLLIMQLWWPAAAISEWTNSWRRLSSSIGSLHCFLNSCITLIIFWLSVQGACMMLCKLGNSWPVVL